MDNPNPLFSAPGIVSRALHTLVSQIPPSVEAPGENPDERVKSLATIAALKAAAISGSFTLPPGPFGMATVLPDLLAVWRIQQQLVADIAAAFGKSSTLTAESMVICLFKHGGAALTRPLFEREGKEVVVQRIANRTLLQLLEKIAVRVAQRIAAKSVYRWLPVLGALGAGAYSFYDTTHVASNAIDLFSRDLRIGGVNQDEPTPALEIVSTSEPPPPPEVPLTSTTPSPRKKRTPRSSKPAEPKPSSPETPPIPPPRRRRRPTGE